MKKVKSHFIKAKVLFTLVLLTLVINSKAQEPIVIDKIVAQVGDEIILLSDIQALRLQYLQEGEEGSASTDCMILEEFMYEKLLVNQAKIDSIEVPNEMVNQEMEQRLRFIAGQIGSMEQLEAYYEKSIAQIKAEFFEIIKKRMLADRMKQTITEQIKMTPKEIKKFYTDLPKDSIPYIGSKITVAHIVIYPELTDADRDKAKNELENYRGQIERSEIRFETIATLHSDDPGSRISGGDLGWQTRGTMVPEFEATLFSLAPKEVSEVFKTQYGYHIIQLMERKGDNYKCRHVLIAPTVSDNALVKAATTIDSVYKEIKKGTITFEEAARRYSNDDDSKFNGGQIVNPYSGDYLWDIANINDIDPQMSLIIERLSVGGISSPALYNNMMKQKQGIRIVKLIGKTKPHIASLETDRQLIEMAALNKKKQAAVEAWIDSKISGNYIQIDKGFLKSCSFKHKWISGS